VRDFKQIAGRAGRKGFDTQGSVVAQAPEHIIEAEEQTERRQEEGHRAGQGEVSWSEETFEKLRTRPPETLKSRFRVTHGMVLSLLQRDAEQDDPTRKNFDSLRELIRRSHEDEGTKKRLLTFAAVLVRSLYRAGILEMSRRHPEPLSLGGGGGGAPVGLLPPPGALALPDRDLGQLDMQERPTRSTS